MKFAVLSREDVFAGVLDGCEDFIAFNEIATAASGDEVVYLARPASGARKEVVNGEGFGIVDERIVAIDEAVPTDISIALVNGETNRIADAFAPGGDFGAVFRAPFTISFE